MVPQADVLRPWWPYQVSHRVSEGIALNNQPGGVLWKKSSVFESLYPSNRGRNGLVDNEEVINVSMARGLVGCMDDATDEAQPIGS